MFSRNFPFSRENALEDYTLERLKHEMIQANEALETFTGRRPTSFAYLCGQRFVGRGKATRSYVPLVAEHFLVGRGFLAEGPNDSLRCDMAQVNGAVGDGRDFEHLGRRSTLPSRRGGGSCSSRTTSRARPGRRR